MTTVFMDTVGLLALWDEGDQWQASASLAMTAVNVPGTRFVTTPYVLLECGNAVARKRYRSDVCQLRDRLAKHGDLIEPSPAEIEEAWTAYRRDSAGGAGIVDHVSFVVMRRLGITDAFTNDRHFKAAGFNTLF
jgi:predicted nucleic acid-binding protein